MWDFKELNAYSLIKREVNEIEIPNSILTLTHLHTFKMIGNGQRVKM
jgi:hypothetical protein